MYINKPRNDKLIQALEAKDAAIPCARCGHTQFEIVGESELVVNKGRLGIIGTQMPQYVDVVLVACSNCGNVSQHISAILSPTIGS